MEFPQKLTIKENTSLQTNMLIFHRTEMEREETNLMVICRAKCPREFHSVLKPSQKVLFLELIKQWVYIWTQFFFFSYICNTVGKNNQVYTKSIYKICLVSFWVCRQYNSVGKSILLCYCLACIQTCYLHICRYTCVVYFGVNSQWNYILFTHACCLFIAHPICYQIYCIKWTSVHWSNANLCKAKRA